MSEAEGVPVIAMWANDTFLLETPGSGPHCDPPFYISEQWGRRSETSYQAPFHEEILALISSGVSGER